MKTRHFASILMSGLLALSPVAALAQPHDGPGGHEGGPGGHEGGGWGGGHGGGPGGGPGRDGGGRDWGGRGGGEPRFEPGHVWHRGDHFNGPMVDRWRINDWHRYPGLWAPPPGYYWMRYGDQFLLTAIAGGLIAGVVAASVSPGYGGYSPY